MQPTKNDGYDDYNNLENAYDIMSSEKGRVQNYGYYGYNNKIY